MTGRAIAALGVLAAASGALWWWWGLRCERVCARVDLDAERFLERGDLLPALELIDRTDARCRCERYTSGDAPPQYAVANAALRELVRAHRLGELRSVASRARGPMLKSLLRDTPEYRAAVEPRDSAAE